MHISIVVLQFRNTHPTALVSYSANLYDLCATINEAIISVLVQNKKQKNPNTV